ncbi:MAG: hypothetical protein V4641_13015 [Pseudomonadota bacterium]
MKIIKLKTEGELQTGDTLECERLGQVTVAWIESIHTLVVKNAAGKYFRLSGLLGMLKQKGAQS